MGSIGIAKLGTVVVPVSDQDRARAGDDVPPLFWFRDPDGNTLMVVQV
jgi:hypothetical protein